MADVTFRGTPDELYRRLALLPAALAGLVPGLERQAAAVAKAGAVELLACVREDNIAKGRGQTGSDGVTWAPLSPRYVAYHRRHKGLKAKRSRAAKAGREARPLLTASQDKFWRGVYASSVARGDDNATAARKAWAVVKKAGGKTILGEYGGAQVEAGRDTGRLLGSLSPGNPDNRLDARPGEAVVGSNVSYFAHFNARRQVVPPPGAPAPPAWEARVEAVLELALAGFIEELLRRRP